jgi:predicted CoA-binding protein
MDAQQLLNYKNWVVAGDVVNPEKYAHRILNSLKEAGFNTEGISPSDKTGTAKKSLNDISYKIDVLDLCINPIKGLQIVQEAKEIGVDKVLIQPGAESEDILDYCRKNNITAIEGCALVELSYYKGKI